MIEIDSDTRNEEQSFSRCFTISQSIRKTVRELRSLVVLYDLSMELKMPTI